MTPQMLASNPLAVTAAAAAAEVASDVNLITILPDNLDWLNPEELLNDLEYLPSLRSAGFAAAGDSDVRDLSPVPADLFDSPVKPEQYQSSAAAAAAVQQLAMPDADTIWKAITATWAAPAAIGSGSSAPHKQAVVGNDYQGYRQVPCQTAVATAASPATATAATAPAAADANTVADQLRTPDGTFDTADGVAVVQLAAAVAQTAELQQQRQLQQDLAASAQADADRWKTTYEQMIRQQHALSRHQT